MWAVPWAEVLVGEDGRPWRTVPQQRSVLVVVHTVTAATRLLDVLPLWARDHRVQTAFTCPRTSAFTAGTEEFLRARGIEPVPWDNALRQEFDLAVAASYGGPLHELRAPLIILPHGIGYNKYLPGTRNSELGTRNSELGTRNSELEQCFRPVRFLAAARWTGRAVARRPLAHRAAGAVAPVLPGGGGRRAGCR